jgi:hypothetical protein
MISNEIFLLEITITGIIWNAFIMGKPFAKGTMASSIYK